MPFELGAKKAGLSIVRAFLHSVEGVNPALAPEVIKRNTITFKYKSYQNGKMVSSRIISSLEDAFPCAGDKK